MSENDSCDSLAPGPETVKRCAGCGFTHSYCTTQAKVEDLLAQLYGAVRHSVGVDEALADVEDYLA